MLLTELGAGTTQGELTWHVTPRSGSPRWRPRSSPRSRHVGRRRQGADSERQELRVLLIQPQRWNTPGDTFARLRRPDAAAALR